MSKLPLSFACGLYDRMQALHTGEVQVEGVDLNFLVDDNPRNIFDRMAAGLEFDAAEFSSSEYISRFVAGQCPFVAVPGSVSGLRAASTVEYKGVPVGVVRGIDFKGGSVEAVQVEIADRNAITIPARRQILARPKPTSA